MSPRYVHLLSVQGGSVLPFVMLKICCMTVNKLQMHTHEICGVT